MHSMYLYHLCIFLSFHKNKVEGIKLPSDKVKCISVHYFALNIKDVVSNFLCLSFCKIKDVNIKFIFQWYKNKIKVALDSHFIINITHDRHFIIKVISYTTCSNCRSRISTHRYWTFSLNFLKVDVNSQEHTHQLKLILISKETFLPSFIKTDLIEMYLWISKHRFWTFNFFQSGWKLSRTHVN